ncbi:MBL fold metallo-hydrolase [Microbacterium sp. PI-1]|uniref:MBL fold metallo-hydrolase n=1 Tax=Microbacterium sp. PI-1 TaxID=2545631 RepID=UPI00103CB93B|nr:MBL fold metallo-hydrolase [Microbacterium sp. PI-1]TCJ21947.1 MBL fold metallo-hydrolase [Microbacterium sp. PI-1]
MPAHPSTVVAAPRIRAIAVPCPEQGVPYTWCYAFDDADLGIHLVDPGWSSGENLRYLINELGRTGRGIDQLRSVTMTHGHLDHIGLADELRARTGAALLMHTDEAASLSGSALTRWDSDELARRFDEWEAPPKLATALAKVLSNRLPTRTVVPDVTLEDGALLPIEGRRIEVLWTPGHTPGHICLRDLASGVILTGDHILSRTNSGLGLGGEYGRNPLVDYLFSLDRVEEIGGTGLPGHEDFLSDVAERARQLASHHSARTTAIDAARRTGARSVWSIAAMLKWSGGWDFLSPHRRFSALTQVSMHLNAMRSGELRQVRGMWTLARDMLELHTRTTPPA